MFGVAILEVAIGVIFVYILISMICSAVREGIETWLKTRAAYLEQGIRELLHDKAGAEDGLARKFYNHPLIYSLFASDYTPRKLEGRPSVMARGGDLPSYIPSRNFALALMDLAARGPDTDPSSSEANAPPVSLDSVRMNIGNIGNPYVQRVLLTAIDSAEGDFNEAVANIERWYDSGMDRVSGWYRRSTQKIILVIALFVSVLLNVDTIRIARYLYEEDSAREAIVAVAENADPSKPMAYEDARRQLDSLKLPVGWEGYRWFTNDRWKWKEFNPWHDGFVPFLGWILTALAATMGAPFWFDILNKVMVIRSTVKPREKSQEEGSEDRRPPAPRVLAPVVAGGGGAAAAFVDDTELDAFGAAGAGSPTEDDQLPEAKGGVQP